MWRVSNATHRTCQRVATCGSGNDRCNRLAPAVAQPAWAPVRCPGEGGTVVREQSPAPKPRQVLPQPVTVKRDPLSPERFLIVDGRVWRVYETRIAEGAEPALVFSSGGQVRFLPRYPLGWYELADDRLTDLYWDADF